MKPLLHGTADHNKFKPRSTLDDRPRFSHALRAVAAIRMNTNGKDRPTKKCVVLGGFGFAGSAFVAEAQRRGYDVIPVGRQQYAEHVGLSCDLLINANGNSRKYLARENPELDIALSVDSVVRSLSDFRASQYVYISSIDVYANTSDPCANDESAPIRAEAITTYGLHKHQAETAVRRLAPAWLVLRVNGLVGPGLWKNSIYDMLRGRPLRVHPDSEYQYLHTRVLASITFDLVAAAAWNETFNAAGDGVIALRKAAAAIPGYRLSAAAEDAPRERYEESILRLQERCRVPSTEETVLQFIRDALAERERIA